MYFEMDDLDLKVVKGQFIFLFQRSILLNSYFSKGTIFRSDILEVVVIIHSQYLSMFP